MSLETVADLPERIGAIPRLPEDVKKLIWLFDAHPTADMVRQLSFEYKPVPYEPLSLYLIIECGLLDRLVGQNRYYCDHNFRKLYWICRSIYRADHSVLPDWVVRSFDSTDQ